MRKLLSVLRYVVAVIILAASLGLLGVWWVLRNSLPQLDGVAALPELKNEVVVNRDRWGVPHIKAASVEDLATAQGYVLAQDRLWQMDLLRRAAAGELSEIFGPVALEMDRENRLLGLRAAAEQSVELADADARGLLEAYARGVNRYIEERRDNLPAEFRVLHYAPAKWTPRDSLLVGAYMYKYLTTTWEWELDRAKIEARIGPELSRELFVEDDPLDHFIVGGSEPAALQKDKLGGKQAPRAAEVTALSVAPLAAGFGILQPQVPAISAEEMLWQSANDFLHKSARDVQLAPGSNNWAVSGKHTMSGRPMLANDTHLELDVPCIWYLVHLTAPGWNVKGFALPGVPMVIIGHNERIAWGFTNNGADVQDLFVETFNPDKPNDYKAGNQWLAAQIRHEVIRVKGQADVTLDVQVTRHGPIVRRDGGRAYALRWTALDPGGLSFGYPWLGKAQNWPEFRETLRRVTGPAQNGVYADVDGNIGFVVAANIPIRKRGEGKVPVPGDTDEYEWTGYIPYDELPVAFNPPGGIIATANARVVGPGYKHYLTDRWVAPYRTERIYELLADRKNLRPEDFITIQTDLLSIPHRVLAEHMLRAVQKKKPQDDRARELMTHLGRWNGRAAANSIDMAFLEYSRWIARRKILYGELGEDYRLYHWWRGDDFLLNVLETRPAHWLPKKYATPGRSPAEGYDELLVAVADEAVRQMERQSGVPNITDWDWGRFMKLQIFHPMGRTGWLRRHLSIGPIPQGGAAETIKQTGASFGPAMRFVADLGNFDNSLMNVTMGQSGQYLSRHYRDQFSYWYEGIGIPSAFSETAEEKSRVHQLRLLPRGASTQP